MGYVQDHSVDITWNRFPARVHATRIVVSIKTTATSERTLAAKAATIAAAVTGAAVGRRRYRQKWFTLDLRPGTDIVAVVGALNQRADVKYAEPDFAWHAHSVLEAPASNDTYLSDQWYIKKIGLDEAWRCDTGSAKILLAVLDSGLAMDTAGTVSHPDFDPARMVIAHTISGTDISHNLIEDTGPPRDTSGHGTHVTGIVAAVRGNSLGIAGAEQTSDVYIARVIDSGNDAYGADIKQAVADVITYAAAHGYAATVINISSGTSVSGDYQALKETCADSVGTGTLIVVAAEAQQDGHADYPARFAESYDHVVAVGMSDETDKPLFAETLELSVLAPGDNILSCTPDYDVTYFYHDPVPFVPGSSTKKYGYMSGESQAAPLVSSLALMIWKKTPHLKPGDLRGHLISTAATIGPDNNRKPRIDARKAVLTAGLSWHVVSPHVRFTDVMEGEAVSQNVPLSVSGGCGVTFELVATGMVPSEFVLTQQSAPYMESTGSLFNKLEITYTGGTAGEVHATTLHVVCIESGETVPIYLLANTVGLPNATVSMVLDQSGSMGWASGVESFTRLEVMKYSAGILADMVRSGSRLGAISFATNASRIADTRLLPDNDPTGVHRQFLKAEIDNLVAGGSTSIGDGIRMAHGDVTANPLEVNAIIVLTDGHENADERIASVFGSLDFSDTLVYAVGMGTADAIQPDTLAELTASSGGYVDLTGALDAEATFRVAKYFLSMHAGLRGESILVDPPGRIRHGMSLQLPFLVTEAEFTADIITMMPGQGVIEVMLVGPDGKRLAAGDVESYIAGNNTTCYRLKLPMQVGRKRLGPGRWIAELALRRGFTPAAGTTAEKLGVPYDILVTAHSSLRMTCTANQESCSPGADLVIRARIRQNRQPLPTPAVVEAFVTAPGGESSIWALSHIRDGTYGTVLPTNDTGVYTVRIIARGQTRAGYPFTREGTVTGFTWRPGAPFPGDGRPVTA